MGQEIDMFASALSVSAEREEVIDFSYLIWEQTSAGLLLTQEKQDQFYIFRPLHPYVWVTFGAAAVIIAVVTSLCEMARIGGRPLGTLSRLRNSLFYTYGAMFYQGMYTDYYSMNRFHPVVPLTNMV